MTRRNQFDDDFDERFDKFFDKIFEKPERTFFKWGVTAVILNLLFWAGIILLVVWGVKQFV